MTLAKRLVVSALLLIGALGLLVMIVIDHRLYRTFEGETAFQLEREARLIALNWRPDVAPDPLADSAGLATGHRVTLIAPDGRVLGDAAFDEPALSQLENHLSRPEVATAAATGVGRNRRTSASAADEEFYVAIRTALGFVRVSVPTAQLGTIFSLARRDVFFAVVVALLCASGLALLFSRSVSRPIVQLRDVARALADGDLTRRPSLAAPAEVGELALAVHGLAEQLTSRLAALQADEALLAAVVESLNEGVVVVERNDSIPLINASGRRLLSVGNAPAITANSLPRDRAFRDALRAALNGDSTDAVEFSHDGRTLALTARPLRPGRAVLAVFDLTALRRLENVRRDFVANVSHELRTPLTVISGFAETLGEGDVPEVKRKEFATRIYLSAVRMQRVVDELLDLSRIESGGWAPRPTSINLDDVASEALAAVQRDAAERGLELVADIAPDASVVFADATAVRQIIDNLMLNAVRHTLTGSVTIFARREPAGIRIGVRDTGVGIAAEHVSRIFERFYRVDSARSRDRGGTGLGLAIVKHLAEAHGGSVRAESTVAGSGGGGGGTTVSVLLPGEVP